MDLTHEVKIYWQNLLWYASDSTKGDGTIYADSTATTVIRSDKKLELQGYSIIEDFAGKGDDWCKGFSVVFPSNGHKYQIEQYIDASNAVILSTYPQTSDTGAAEIRAGLVESAFDTDYPINQVADLKRWSLWKSSAANQAAHIYVYSPNYIRDGGFEECYKHDFRAPWTEGYGASGWDVDTTAQIGTYGALFTDDSTDSCIWQAIEPLKEGRTYKLIFLKTTLMGNGTNVGRIEIENKETGTLILGYTFSATTTDTWDSTEFTPTFNTRDAVIKIYGQGASGTWGSATHLAIDELYLYEKIPVERMIIDAHNLGSYSDTTTVMGLYCNHERSNFDPATDAEKVYSLSNEGEEIVNVAMDSTTSYPVYRIALKARPGITHEAGELFLGPKLDVEWLKAGSVDPARVKIKEKVNTTESGKTFVHVKYEQRNFREKLFFTTAAAYTKFEKLWEDWASPGRPVFFCWNEADNPEDTYFARLKRVWRSAYRYLPNDYRELDINLTEEL